MHLVHLGALPIHVFLVRRLQGESLGSFACAKATARLRLDHMVLSALVASMRGIEAAAVHKASPAAVFTSVHVSGSSRVLAIASASVGRHATVITSPAAAHIIVSPLRNPVHRCTALGVVVTTVIHAASTTVITSAAAKVAPDASHPWATFATSEVVVPAVEAGSASFAVVVPGRTAVEAATVFTARASTAESTAAKIVLTSIAASSSHWIEAAPEVVLSFVSRLVVPGSLGPLLLAVFSVFSAHFRVVVVPPAVRVLASGVGTRGSSHHPAGLTLIHRSWPLAHRALAPLSAVALAAWSLFGPIPIVIVVVSLAVVRLARAAGFAVARIVVSAMATMPVGIVAAPRWIASLGRRAVGLVVMAVAATTTTASIIIRVVVVLLLVLRRTGLVHVVSRAPVVVSAAVRSSRRVSAPLAAHGTHAEVVEASTIVVAASRHVWRPLRLVVARAKAWSVVIVRPRPAVVVASSAAIVVVLVVASSEVPPLGLGLIVLHSRHVDPVSAAASSASVVISVCLLPVSAVTLLVVIIAAAPGRIVELGPASAFVVLSFHTGSASWARLVLVRLVFGRWLLVARVVGVECGFGKNRVHCGNSALGFNLFAELFLVGGDDHGIDAIELVQIADAALYKLDEDICLDDGVTGGSDLQLLVVRLVQNSEGVAEVILDVALGSHVDLVFGGRLLLEELVIAGSFSILLGRCFGGRNWDLFFSFFSCHFFS